MTSATDTASTETLIQSQEPQLHQQSTCKLYVGNLDPRVDEPYLHQLFNLDATADLIESVKIIPQPTGVYYGFVEFRDAQHAENAIQLLNGKRVFNNDIRVNWAFTGSTSREELATHAHIFVGDLGSEITDQLLAKAFSAFGALSDARVMWDPASGKSRGYGFVAFKDRTDAERAINAMNNEWLGSRAVRVNWANQKSQGLSHHHISNNFNSIKHENHARNGIPKEATSLEAVMAQSHIYNTTVYIGNITPHTSQIDIAPLFSQFGFIRELRLQSEKGFGFVKLDTHENAAMAIFSLNGYALHGRQIKCSWGKERMPDINGFHPMNMQNFVYPQPPVQWYFPQGDQNGAQGMMPLVATGPPTYDPAGAVYAAGASPNQQQYWETSQQNQLANGYY
ncbi:hypothetical protein HDU99_009690 [Rhizoclosmatium hyalinum]|nr:hypothetical protein HDU99_009690 [Rhizoclosmatium hyalinum]